MTSSIWLAVAACVCVAPLPRASAQAAAETAFHPILLGTAAGRHAAAAKDAREAPAEAGTATDGEAIPAEQVHPITSLPRPRAAMGGNSALLSSEVAEQPAYSTSARLLPVSLPAAPSTPAAATLAEVEAPAQPMHVSLGVSAGAAETSEAPDPAPMAMAARRPAPLVRQPMRPFSGVAVAFKASLNGLGADLAVPLSEHWNARVGGALFGYNGTYSRDGITASGQARLRTANLALDFFPGRNGFHISPGFTFYNGNRVDATAIIPAGQTFTLNDVTYTSALNDPVRGSGTMSMGSRMAPSLTVGWGNLLPRSGSRFSIPVEAGVQYVGAPAVTMALTGTACSTQGTASGCAQLQSDPIAQDNLAKEQKIWNDAVQPLRFYPILSVGVSWRLTRPHASVR